MNPKQKIKRARGVLSKGSKVLDDLSGMGYRVATLPDWMGPTSEELAKGNSDTTPPTSQVPQTPLGGVGEVSDWGTVTKETPPQGPASTLGQATPATPYPR